MNAHTSRRAFRLVATMAAAGLALTVAPTSASGEETGTAMKLTSAEAETLADRVGIDVHGRHAPQATPEGTGEDSSGAGTGAEPAPDQTGTSDTGSGTQATDTPVTFTQASALEGVRGVGVTVPAGDDGSYFTVHSLGNIQRHRPDGSTAWERTNTSYYTDWQVKPLQAWRVEPYPVAVMMGYNAVSPFTPASDQGFDTGDLTGDGVSDVAFSAYVGDSPFPRAFTSPGSSLSAGSFVTVLDGSTGRTVWSKLYAYASKVQVIGDTLLIADSPRQNRFAPTTQPATLTGIRFTAGGGMLTPAATWTHDTTETARASWAAIEDLGDGKVAASWNLARTATTAARGRTLVLDVEDGFSLWQTDSTLYSRQLHLDATRQRIVALEQGDVTEAVMYDIAAYSLGSGARTVLDTRVNVLPTAMMVGDVAPGGDTEYAVSESSLDSHQFINASTIRVMDGADGNTVRWTHTTKRDAANSRDGASTWALDAMGGKLVASAQDDRDITTAVNVGGLQYGSLTVFGGSGTLRWRQRGLTASPMLQQPFNQAGQELVRVIDQQQNVRTHRLSNGRLQDLTPLRAELNHAEAAHLDGDGAQDVVTGGTSNGVWAFAGSSLVGKEPKQLWQATVPGQVHDLATGDVNGDGTDDVAVAADIATVLLDGRTGATLATMAGTAQHGQFVRSVTLADLDGDGRDEVLVPTDALRAYRGDGAAMWTYAAPTTAGDVVFSDTVVSEGRVHTQYGSLKSLARNDAAQGGVALRPTDGTPFWTAIPEAPAIADGGRLHGALIDHAVFASPDIPFAEGHAVVHTWMIRSQVPGFPTTPISPHVVIEIRDGRTGELLHQYVGGSPWSHGNYFTGSDALYQLSFGTFHGFKAGGVETYSSVAAPLRSGALATGPNGRELLLGGTESGVGAWDPSVLTSGWSFQSGVGRANLLGGRSYLAADLDGDGDDDVVSLNYDDFGVHRAAELLGGGVLSLDNGIHQMTTFTLS